MRSASLAMTLLGVTGLAGQEHRGQPSSSAPMLDLHKGEVTQFSAPGPVAVASMTKCNGAGDIYAIYSSTSPREMWGGPIKRVSVSSRNVTEYPIPAISGYQKPARASFDVGADGTLYALLQAYPQSDSKSRPDPVYLIVKYKDDGRVDSYFALGELPGKHIQPTSIAVFADRSFLISDHY